MTQAHTRSKSFDPADYKLEAVFDNHEDGGWDIMDDANIGIRGWFTVSPTEAFSDEVGALYERMNGQDRCDHCGKVWAFRYECFVRYIPTGELLLFGSTCVAEAIADDKAALAERRLGQAAELRAKVAAWTAEYPEQAAALETYKAEVEAGTLDFDSFLDDLVRSLRTYGSLTEKQSAWPVKALENARKFQAARAEREAKMAAAPKLEVAEGRQEVVGTVVSTKWVDNDFGGSLKMLVELEDGNRLWGTVPSSLSGVLLDAKVAFTAKLEVSDNDEHFGFFSRPTKARLLD